MKKVRIFQRPDRPGWHVSWRENGKEKKRSFPTKNLADHFKSFKYAEINSDVFRSIVDLPWEQLKAEYLRTYDVRRLTESSKYEGGLTLRHFASLVGPVSSQNISQGIIDAFLLARMESVGDWTLNKDIKNLTAFLNWCKKHHYIKSEIETKKIKTTPRSIPTLKDRQIKNLLISARQRSETWYVRVLLAITTGLRSRDIERILIGDIDFETNTVRTHSKKTRKSMAARPLHSSIAPVLTRYIYELPDWQERLLADDTNTFKKWKKIRERAGLPDLRFHDLRSIFSTTLQSKGVSLSAVQALLEHSSPEITAKHYTNTDSLLIGAIGILPVDEWLCDE